MQLTLDTTGILSPRFERLRRRDFLEQAPSRGATSKEEERRAAAQTKFTSSRKVETRLELPWNSDPGPHKNPGTFVAEETETIQGLATAEPRNVLGDGSRDSRSVNNTERSFAAPQLEAKGL